MEIKEIQLVTDIENIYDDGVDVIVTLDHDFSYVIEVVTPATVYYDEDNRLIVSFNQTSGFITQLWKDSKDIEFVKQTIGHRKLDTTSAYIKSLSDLERQERIENI